MIYAILCYAMLCMYICTLNLLYLPIWSYMYINYYITISYYICCLGRLLKVVYPWIPRDPLQHLHVFSLLPGLEGFLIPGQRLMAMIVQESAWHAEARPFLKLLRISQFNSLKQHCHVIRGPASFSIKHCKIPMLSICDWIAHFSGSLFIPIPIRFESIDNQHFMCWMDYKTRLDWV